MAHAVSCLRQVGKRQISAWPHLYSLKDDTNFQLIWIDFAPVLPPSLEGELSVGIQSVWNGVHVHVHMPSVRAHLRARMLASPSDSNDIIKKIE